MLRELLLRRKSTKLPRYLYIHDLIVWEQLLRRKSSSHSIKHDPHLMVWELLLQRKTAPTLNFNSTGAPFAPQPAPTEPNILWPQYTVGATFTSQK